MKKYRFYATVEKGGVIFVAEVETSGESLSVCLNIARSYFARKFDKYEIYSFDSIT